MTDRSDSIQTFLRKLRRRLWLRWSGWAFSFALPHALLALALGAAVESLLWLSPQERAWLTLFTVLFTALPLLLMLLPLAIPLLKPAFVSDRALARRVLQRDPEVSDSLLVALELTAGLREGSSPELAAMAAERAGSIAEQLDVEEYLDPRFPKLVRTPVLVASALLLAVLLLGGGRLLPALDRIAHPNTAYVRPDAPSLELAMADTVQVVEGDSLALSARGEYLRGAGVVFRMEDFAGLPRLAEGSPNPDDSTLYTASLDRILRSGYVTATSGRLTSDTSWIEVVHRPRIARLEVRIEPPAYTGQRSIMLPPGVGDVTALPGSRVHARIETSRPLSRVVLFFEREGKQARPVRMSVDQNRVRGAFTLEEAGQWWVELTAEDGVRGDAPVKWTLRLQPDQPPTLDVRLPRPDALLGDELIMPLWAIASDDYGISRMQLRWQIVSSMLEMDDESYEDERMFEAVSLGVEQNSQGDAEIRTLWNLEALPLLPTDEIHWFVEAWDNDAVGGAKRVRSETRRLLFPSVEELFARSDEQEAQAEAELARTMERAKAVEQQIRETLLDAKSNPEEISWEEAQALQKQLAQQEEAISKLEDVQKQVQQLQQMAQEHGTLSEEVLEKYAEMQQVLAEITTPELREAMERMQDALKNLDGDEVREALQQLLANQEQLRQNLERSLAVLKQLREERRLDELATLADKLAERQRHLADATENAQTEDALRLAREQQLISQEFEALQRRMAETATDSSLQHADIADSLAALEQQTEADGVRETLERSQQQIESGNPGKATQSAQKGAEQLESLAQQLRQLQQQVQQRGKQDVLERMDRLFDGILAISQEQQRIRQQSESLGIASPLYRSLAADQRSLIDGVRQLRRELEELSSRTFFVGKSLDAQLELAGEAMERAITQYTDRQAREAGGDQTRAMAMLHRGLLTLLQSRQQAQQAGSGTGYDEIMKQLEQMAQMQQQLNQGSGQMPMPMPGSAGAQQLAQMAARQRALAQQLESMQPRGGSAREILGNLEGVSRAMEEVANDLENRNVTERTRRLQRRILQHLLESQRSLAQQDRSRERTGQIADDLTGESPGALGEERTSELERRMERALAEEWDPRWRETIRAYFRAMQRDAALEE